MMASVSAPWPPARCRAPPCPGSSTTTLSATRCTAVSRAWSSRSAAAPSPDAPPLIVRREPLHRPERVRARRCRRGRRRRCAGTRAARRRWHDRTRRRRGRGRSRGRTAAAAGRGRRRRRPGGRGVGQHPVAEAPARLLEAAERLHADDAVDGEPALLLERADRRVDGVVEGVGGGVVPGLAGRTGQQPESAEPVADLRDRRAGVPPSVAREGSRRCYRNSARSASSAALGLAPTICFTSRRPGRRSSSAWT